MKNLAFALFTALLLAACSSGTTSADLPQNITGVYIGTFANTPGSQSGTITLNLSQPSNELTVLGNLVTSDVVQDELSITCVPNSTLTGTVNGFGVSLTAGTTNFQLTLNGNTLSGTYVTTGTPEGCSGGTGSGTITVSR